MPIPAPFLNGVRREYNIDYLVEATAATPTMPGERRLLSLLLPPWQRPEVWSFEKKRSFIEGLFHGFGAGFYVVNGQDYDGAGNTLPMAGWLLDGQQRIASLRDFLNGELVIFGDVTFQGLTKSEQLRFLRRPFPCFELEYTNDEHHLKALYDRLNFGGVPHTEAQRALPVAEDQQPRSAAERETLFRADLAALLARHGAEITISDDGRPYGMHSGTGVVSMNGTYTADGDPIHEYTEFNL